MSAEKQKCGLTPPIIANRVFLQTEIPSKTEVIFLFLDIP